eukprot:Pgem_evm12s14806
MLVNVLKRSHLQEKTIQKIVSDSQNQKIFLQAFTHISYDSENNYEFLELIGDCLVNACMVFYFHKSFSELNNCRGVKIISRLKINLVSRKSLSSLARELGFTEFIRYQSEFFSDLDKVQEDVFEAFFGALIQILDSKKLGHSFVVSYQIISNLLQAQTLSLQYDALYDSKTRLKETVDMFRSQIGNLKYNMIKKEEIVYKPEALKNFVNVVTIPSSSLKSEKVLAFQDALHATERGSNYFSNFQPNLSRTPSISSIASSTSVSSDSSSNNSIKSNTSSLGKNKRNKNEKKNKQDNLILQFKYPPHLPLPKLNYTHYNHNVSLLNNSIQNNNDLLTKEKSEVKSKPYMYRPIFYATTTAEIAGKDNIIIGLGFGLTKRDAEQIAAQQAIYTLKDRFNIFKKAPEEYEELNNLLIEKIKNTAK